MAKTLDVKNANPYRHKTEFDRIKPEAVKKDESETAFKMLGQFLRTIGKKPRFKNLLNKDKK